MLWWGRRCDTLNAVIWSRGVQMGGCSVVFARAVEGMDLSTASDEDIIKAIYEENSRLTTKKRDESSKIIKAEHGDKYGITGKYLYYFASSNSENQASVYNRLANEEIKEALKMLKKFG